MKTCTSTVLRRLYGRITQRVVHAQLSCKAAAMRHAQLQSCKLLMKQFPKRTPYNCPELGALKSSSLSFLLFAAIQNRKQLRFLEHDFFVLAAFPPPVRNPPSRGAGKFSPLAIPVQIRGSKKQTPPSGLPLRLCQVGDVRTV